MSTQGTAQTAAVAPRPKQPVDKATTIKATINGEKFKKSIADVLPKHMTANRQLMVLCAAVNKTPKLSDCTWASLAQCMIDCSAMGLEPDGRRAHLIPYGQTCTLIVDYKGLVELIYRSGAVDFIDAYPVYENELKHDPDLTDAEHPNGRPRFDIEYGANPKIFHKPMLIDEPGEFVGAYCVAHIKNISKPKFVWMTKREIDTIRKRSKASGNGPWVTDYIEMAKKTTIRRISKTLPLSPEINELLMKDIEHEHGTRVVGSNMEPLQPSRQLADPDGAKQLAEAFENAQSTIPVEVSVETDPPQQEDGDGSELAEAGLAPAQPAAAAVPPVAAAAAPAKPAATTPAQPPKAAAAQPPPGDEKTVAQIVALCVAEKIEEKQVCMWAAKKFGITETDNIQMICDFAPRKVSMILMNWTAYLPEIKAWKL